MKCQTTTTWLLVFFVGPHIHMSTQVAIPRPKKAVGPAGWRTGAAGTTRAAHDVEHTHFLELHRSSTLWVGAAPDRHSGRRLFGVPLAIEGGGGIVGAPPIRSMCVA